LPRRRKSEEEEKSKATSSKKAKSSTKKKTEKYVDPDKLLDEYIDELIVMLGLSYLNLSREEFKEVLREPFAAAVGEVKTKPKLSTILNRLRAMGDGLMEIIAYKLLKIYDIEKLNNDQLEFIVNYIRNGIVQIVDKLYNECLKRNRNDLVDILRNNWNIYSNGLRSPIRCPRCGFDSVMPDFTCKVCGYSLSMKELKNQIKIIDLLQDYMKIDLEGFNEILKAGFFYYTVEGPIPPSKFKPKQDQLYFEIILNKDEKQKLQSISHNILPGS
jgi:ribosomal protein L37E